MLEHDSTEDSLQTDEANVVSAIEKLLDAVAILPPGDPPKMNARQYITARTNLLDASESMLNALATLPDPPTEQQIKKLKDKLTEVRNTLTQNG